jgi:hypothetical protein
MGTRIFAAIAVTSVACFAGGCATTSLKTPT